MIRVYLFASLREAAGTSELRLPAVTALTAREVFNALIRERPTLEPLKAITLVAVNDQFADWDTVVSPGGEVAFFPPVSGGAGWSA